MRCTYQGPALSIPAPSKLLSESPQAPRLILLDIQQLLRTGVPQRRVSYILGAFVHWHGIGRSVYECGAIRERYELREGVGAFRTPEEGCVPDLVNGRWRDYGEGGLESVEGLAKGAQGAKGRYGRGHWDNLRWVEEKLGSR